LPRSDQRNRITMASFKRGIRFLISGNSLRGADAMTIAQKIFLFVIVAWTIIELHSFD
jgi:hypothetical protein